MMSIAYMGMYASYAGGRLVPLGGALTFRPGKLASKMSKLAKSNLPIWQDTTRPN